MTSSRKTSPPSLFGWFHVGPADLVAADEPDTSSGALWRTLRSDRIGLFLLAALSFTLALDILATVTGGLAFLERAGDLLRPVLAILALRAGLSRVIHQQERQVWNGLAAAFALWLGALLILTFSAPSSRPTELFSAVLYAVSFLALIVAFEQPMKRRRGLHAADYGVTLTWSGGTVFVAGVLFYFVIAPLTFDLPAEDMQRLHIYMFLVFDFYVVSKLIYFGGISEPPRWKMLYSLLILMMASMLMCDLIDCLVSHGALSTAWGSLSNLAWVAPYLFLILAARLRHHPFPSEESLFDSVSRKDPLPWPRERLVGYALFFPLMHFVFHFLGLLDAASQTVREGFVLLWLLLFGAMAIIQQRLLEGKARSLWTERLRSEDALHRSKETLRLARERQSAELALRKSEEKFDKAFRSIPDAMVISTVAGGHILEVNNSFHGQFGYSREEVLGKTGVELKLWVEPEDRAMMTRLLRERGSVQNLEFKLTRKSGEMRLTLLSGEIIDLDGEAAILMVMRDITEEYEVEEKLRRSRRLESIGSLTSAVAYDLNNVLIPISTTIKALRQAPLEKKYEPFVASLEEHARHGMDMVNQILAFSGRGSERLAFQPKNLMQDVERVARECLPDSIHVRTIMPEEPWTVEGNAGQLHHVLRHLLINAREAIEKCVKLSEVDTRRETSLTLEIENVWMDAFYAQRHAEAHEGPYVVITVSDTGCGISDDHLGQIFDPYFTTKNDPEGVGLGLAISETIVKSHGGFMVAYSEESSGTNFQIYLPAAAGDRDMERVVAELPAGHGETVLVVDDDVSICDIVRETLEAFGYEVISAHNGAEAIELYSQHRSEIDVVMIDMIMPMMDGETTMRRLQTLDPSVTVIAVSGLTAREGPRLHENVRDFFEKPYTAEKLLTSLQHVLTPTV